MEDTEIRAWMAGFFDGEGCIFIKRASPTESNGLRNFNYSLCLDIGSTSKTVLDLWKGYFGGTIAKRTDKRPGLRAISWNWRAHTGRAEEVLQKLLPYLQLKKDEALCALEFQTLLQVTKANKPRPGIRGMPRLSLETVAQRDAYYWRLRELKQEMKTFK